MARKGLLHEKARAEGLISDMLDPRRSPHAPPGPRGTFNHPPGRPRGYSALTPRAPRAGIQREWGNPAPGPERLMEIIINHRFPKAQAEVIAKSVHSSQ